LNGYKSKFAPFPKLRPINIIGSHLCFMYVKSLKLFSIHELLVRITCIHRLKQNSIFPPNQFGFRHQISPLDCVSTLVADIIGCSLRRNVARRGKTRLRVKNWNLSLLHFWRSLGVLFAGKFAKKKKRYYFSSLQRVVILREQFNTVRMAQKIQFSEMSSRVVFQGAWLSFERQLHFKGGNGGWRG